MSVHTDSDLGYITSRHMALGMLLNFLTLSFPYLEYVGNILQGKYEISFNDAVKYLPQSYRVVMHENCHFHYLYFVLVRFELRTLYLLST